MKLLCLSNGHGEDVIAVRVARELLQYPCPPAIQALPLVGRGRAYSEAGIPLTGPLKTLPSGGFVYMSGRQLWRDLRGGLLQLTLTQWQALQSWKQRGGSMILAVGDIVPLLFAWLSGLPYAFVGTAKSEYYLRDEAGLLPRRSWFERLESWSGSVYLPWERWLMQRRNCKAVFPRDRLTTTILKRWSIPAHDLGNPMMDGLEPSGLHFQTEVGSARPLTLVLLPGSRSPEAYANWQRILEAVAGIVETFSGHSLLFLGAIAPGLAFEPLKTVLEQQNWHWHSAEAWEEPWSSPQLFTCGQATLILTQNAFNDCLHQADFAIATAGTATEQFVGLGKPAITLPGKGPQFTPAFAEAQSRLLGPSVILVRRPTQAADSLKILLRDPDQLHLIAENGRQRMGTPGAAQRIAEHLWMQLKRLEGVG